MSYFLLVPALVFFVRPWRVSAAWPLGEALILAAGLLFVVLFFDFLPRWPELFNSDMELLFVWYLCATVAYVSSVARMVGSWAARSWSRFAAAFTVAACCGLVVFVVSWAVVYFE